MRLAAPLFLGLMVLVAWNLLAGKNDAVQASDISPDHEVVFFTAPWCGFCDQAREYLDSSEVNYLEIDIEASTANQARFRDLGGRGVPLIYIGDERIAGFSVPVYQQALQRIE